MPLWNPWKLMTVTMLLVLATALVTGLVVANWTGGDTTAAEPPKTAPRPPARPATPRVAGVPGPQVVDACNRSAATQVGQHDTSVDTVKDVAVVAGTRAGLTETKKHDERYREAYAGCLRSRGYAA